MTVYLKGMLNPFWSKSKPLPPSRSSHHFDVQLIAWLLRLSTTQTSETHFYTH